MSGQADILGGVKRGIRRAAAPYRRRADRWDFPNWLATHIRVRDGKPYSFDGFEPYLPIAKSLHEHEQNWFLKGTQIGFSTLMIGWNLYLPHWRGFDCAYALPDKVMIKPFMKTRFTKQQIRASQELAAAYDEHESDLYYSAGANFLYFLGANVLSEALSRPIDQISLDEVTIIKRDSIELIQERMDASPFAQLNGFAREIYPGGPADVGFSEGTQNIWLVTCPACKKEQVIEESIYDDSLNKLDLPRALKLIGGLWRVVCVHCEKPYSRAQAGEWVARHPQRDTQSYRLPQVVFEGMDLQRFVRKWERSRNKKSMRAKLHASALAIPDAGDLQRLTRETIIALKRPYPLRRRASWSIGGMDMGNSCWPVFATMDEGSELVRVIWLQEVDSDIVFEVVSRLMVELNTQLFVMDALPLTTEARKFAYAFGDIVVLNYYQGKELDEKQGDHLGKEYRYITQDREQCLDAYCDALTGSEPALVFPARVLETGGGEVDLEESTFAAHHLRGSQKDEIDDPRLGKKVYKFKKHVPNHYFHSMAYLWTAVLMLAQQRGQFVGCMPVGGELVGA